MIKKIFLTACLGVAVVSSAAENPAGAAIFSERGCTMCHQTDNETIGPSIRTIAMRYSGNENGLVAYLKGQGQPIVYPERDMVMRPQLMKLGGLYEEEYRSLARYIIQAFMRVDF